MSVEENNEWEDYKVIMEQENLNKEEGEVGKTNSKEEDNMLNK